MKKALLAMLFVSASCCYAQSPSPTSTDKVKKCPVPTVTSTQPAQNFQAPSGTADLHSVIVSVEAAIKCYQDNIGDGPDALPRLQKAVFDFKTTTGKVGGFSVSFFIFKIGASKEKDFTNQITFTYGLPPKKTEGLALKTKVPPQPLADAIVADMQSAAAAVKDGAKLDKLSFNQLNVVLQFGIQFDGNVAINAPVQLVTLGASGDYKKNEAQTVTLTFAPPEPTTKPKQKSK